MAPKSTAAPVKGKSAITSFFKPAATRSRQTPVDDSPAPSQGLSQPSDPASSRAPSASPAPCSEQAQAPTQPPQSANRVSQLASSPALRSPSPLPPSSPIVKPPVSVARDAVIAASDDEDDGFEGSDSDDMVDIMAAFDPSRNTTKNKPPPPPLDASLFETPKAKKRFVSKNIHASPLTFHFKNDRHDFDMKALLEDAAQDEAHRASFLRNQEESAAYAKAEALEAQAGKDAAYLGIIAQTGGENAHKVLRTMRRAQTSKSAAVRYLFFDQEKKLDGSIDKPPKRVATGPWKMLAQGSAAAREQYLVSGMPYTILRKTGGLPEELFDWMLADLCVTSSRLVQMEYAKLISLCPEYVHKRITVERLGEVFSLLGADARPQPDGGVHALVRPSEDPYQGKDWSNLRALLRLLVQVVEAMSVGSVMFAARTLLRMSMDKFICSTMDVLAEYQTTISALGGSLPALAWSSFCAEVSKELYQSFKVQSVRTNALVCLPIGCQRTHELRRRLAITFLFGDPRLGAQHPDSIISLRRMIDCFMSEAFDVTPETDYDELRATVFMLDIAANDGSWATTTKPEEEKQFNKDVDELALAIRGLNRGINDAGGQTGRSNIKGVAEWVEKRIQYQVRTRPKPKTSIFDIGKDKEDPTLPRQQKYMRSFLGKPVGGTNS